MLHDQKESDVYVRISPVGRKGIEKKSICLFCRKKRNRKEIYLENLSGKSITLKQRFLWNYPYLKPTDIQSSFLFRKRINMKPLLTFFKISHWTRLTHLGWPEYWSAIEVRILLFSLILAVNNAFLLLQFTALTDGNLSSSRFWTHAPPCRGFHP